MIKSEVRHWLDSEMENFHFDSLALGVLDLETYQTDALQIGHRFENHSDEAYFDLASLSKPLNFFPWYCQHPQLFTKERLLLLNHQAGLPISGRLHKDTWNEQVLSYSLSESATNYSDFSPLRLMLELETEANESTLNIGKKYWNEKVVFWRDLPQESFSIPTGVRNNKLIKGQVHDDKAFVIEDYTAHAGLFSTINGILKTLASWCKDHQLIEKVTSQMNEGRFALGWDTVKDPQSSLAGSKSCLQTFGHLGFTGTSMWISPKNKKAIVVLTNETLKYWYDRKKLASFRKTLHDLLW